MKIEIAEPGRMTQSGSSLLKLIQNNKSMNNQQNIIHSLLKLLKYELQYSIYMKIIEILYSKLHRY